MKKILVFSLILSIALIAAAAPSINTTSGTLRTVTALDKASRLTFSMHAFATSKDFSSIYTLTNGNTAYAYDTYGMGNMNYGLAYTFTKWLEISAQGTLFADAYKMDPSAAERPGGNYASYGMGDTYIGLKLTTNGLFGSTDAADIGVFGFYSINTGDRPVAGYSISSFASTAYNRKTGGIFRYFTSNSRDYGAMGIISFKTETQVPMMIDINGGYARRTINTNSSAGNYWIYNAAYSVDFGTFVPFIEFSGNKYVGATYFEDKYIVYASGGVRFDTPAGVVIDLGADYRVTRFATDLVPDTIYNDPLYVTTGWGAFPDWRVHFGFSYYYDFIKEIEPEIVEEKKTMITGKIVDAGTGQPLSAQITMPGYSEDVSIVTDSTGTYSIEVNPGTLRIRVNREGYKWVEKGIIIEKGQTKIVDFALVSKKKAYGTITGKVTDKSTGEIIYAEIKFPATDIPDFTADASTGIYRIDLTPGTYTMAAIADGYINWSQPVVIEQDKTLVQNVEMLKKGGKINLVGIYFDSGKATIRPESYPILDNAVKMLKQNPKVKIEIQGHTDSVGSATSNLNLSQSRAESVRNYLIMNGIESWRIIAKGYGESMPIATNTTRDGRSQNRRIEFLILGE